MHKKWGEAKLLISNIAFPFRKCFCFFFLETGNVGYGLNVPSKTQVLATSVSLGLPHLQNRRGTDVFVEVTRPHSTARWEWTEHACYRWAGCLLRPSRPLLLISTWAAAATGPAPSKHTQVTSPLKTKSHWYLQETGFLGMCLPHPLARVTSGHSLFCFYIQRDPLNSYAQQMKCITFSLHLVPEVPAFGMFFQFILTAHSLGAQVCHLFTLRNGNEIRKYRMKMMKDVTNSNS